MQQEEVRFCVYALIEYEDVGDPTVVHQTKVCDYSVTSKGNPQAVQFASCYNSYEDAN
jgi:hypothetical protein